MFPKLRKGQALRYTPFVRKKRRPIRGAAPILNTKKNANNDKSKTNHHHKPNVIANFRKPNIHLNLRDAINKDLELTYRIKTNSIKMYVERIWTWNKKTQRKIHETNFMASKTKIIIHDLREVGYLVLKETFDEIYIENLLIDNEFQNLGIGKTIMKEIIERATSEKKLIYLQVFKINIKAIKFYRNLGFEKTSEMENHVGMKKKWL
ncbi:GNAT family N-acetyltransferase [Pedobacter sp. SD-b]|uniref:GNAT family N-acetyltransferase n=1 Tax=Pedobacter segetis TaxID=2793069 RepID=A0ABS1BH30_9SPHI|nr:GNAT family N-acetyltransferase [Pedobacter segetis]MBK0382169.1 GNAT family N-acetyltransferase [Pedobacter segetis]